MLENMRYYFTFISLILFQISFSQCEDIDKLELGGTYLSRTNNYISFETKYKDTIYHQNISYPNDLEKIKKYADFIFSKSKEYIINRAGESFYNKLTLYQVEVNYPETVEIKNSDDEIFFELSNFEVSYWIIYTYKNNNYKYAFGLEFDKNGELISENKFPNYLKNQNFENLTDPCKALALVKKKRSFKNKKVDYIELAYLEEKNSFCWLIEEKPEINQEFGKWEEKKVNLYYVNANSNKLELVKKDKNLSIACGFRKLTKKEIRQRKRRDKKSKGE